MNKNSCYKYRKTQSSSAPAVNIDRLKEKLRELDEEEGRYVFRYGDFLLAFPDHTESSIKLVISKALKENVIVKAIEKLSKFSPVIFVNPDAKCRDDYILEHIAESLRSGHLNYISVESALFEYGMIDEDPKRLTVMTTGRPYTYHTIYGDIEFRKIKRWSPKLSSTFRHDYTVRVSNDRPLRIATRDTAILDLSRKGETGSYCSVSPLMNFPVGLEKVEMTKRPEVEIDEDIKKAIDAIEPIIQQAREDLAGLKKKGDRVFPDRYEFMTEE